MSVALLLYYSSCHALAIACTIFAFIRRGMVSGGALAPDPAQPSRDLRFAIMLSFLALATVGMAYGFFQNGGADPNLGLVKLCSGISLIGLAGSIFAVPFFASSFGPSGGSKLAVRLFGALASASLPAAPLVLSYDSTGLARDLSMPSALFMAGALVAAIIWSGFRLFAALRGLEAPERRGVEAKRWASTLKAILALSCALCPLVVANDIFLISRLLWPFPVPNLLPLLAVGIGISHLAASLKANLEVQRAAAEARSSPMGTIADETGVAMREPGWSNAGLTPRETEVARLLVSGYSYKGIAERLGIGPATVKTHILKVYDKTGAGSKLELLLFADERR